MSLIKHLPVFLCLLILPQAVFAQVAMTDLDDTLSPIRAQYELPAIVAAVVKNGEIVAAGAVGERALGSGVPVTVDDRIHFGSNGKAMTATLAAIVVEDGKLSWDSTIGEVLGGDVKDLNPKLAAVTLEQLLSHTSGIPTDTPEMIDIYFNTNAFDHNPSTLRLMALETWKANEPVVPEGSAFQYANFGYMMAGAMVEKATGEPWERLIRTLIYEPLGLKTAGLGATATIGLTDAAVGHLRQPDGTLKPMLWGAAADMPPILGPAGIVHMSILDNARWAAWNAGKGERGPALISPKTLQHLFAEKVRTPARPNPPPGTPAEGGYASGWSLEKFDWTDRELLTHNGSNGLNLAKILVDTDRDLAIVVATNVGGTEADLGAGAVMRMLYQKFR